MRRLLEAQGQGCNAVQRSAPKCIAQRGQTAAAAILHPSANVQIAGPIGGSLRGGRALVRLPVYGRGDHSNPSRDCACRSACATNTPRFRAINRTLPSLVRMSWETTENFHLTPIHVRFDWEPAQMAASHADTVCRRSYRS